MARLVIALLVSSQVTRAGVTISFPLEGYYRPGRYMPVHLSATGNETITLRATGSVPTQVSAAANVDLIVPWLTLETVRNAHWSSSLSGDHLLDSLKPLPDDQRLVGLVGDDGSAANLLFPNQKIIPVTLDASAPLLTPAAAWETLDGVLLDVAAAARLKPVQISTILAARTIIAVRSDTLPDKTWPWERRGPFWVLRHPPVGPTSPLTADAYTPTYDWQRGWPADFHRQVLLAAALFSILALGVTLYRSRFMLVALGGLCVIAVAGFAWWYRRQPANLTMIANVWVRDGSLTQRDTWRWESAVRPVDRSSLSPYLSHPVFVSTRQIEQTKARLLVSDAGGRWVYTYHVEPYTSLAFLTRGVWPSGSRPPLDPSATPFPQFVQQLYLGEEEKLVGTVRLPGSEETRTAALIERTHR